MDNENNAEREIEQEMSQHLNAAIMVAARAGQTLARHIERQMREAQADSEQRTKEVTARLVSEREAARAQFAPVHSSEWWNTAKAEDIGRAWEAVEAWQPYDSEARDAGRRMVSECYARWDLDVATHGTTLDDIRDALDRAEEERATHEEDAREDKRSADELSADAERADERASEAANDQLDAESDVDDPDRDQRAADAGDEMDVELRKLTEAEAGADARWDSAERREGMAQSLSEKIDNDKAVEARVRADTAQGKPATEATKNTAGKAPKARKNRSMTQGARKDRSLQK